MRHHRNELLVKKEDTFRGFGLSEDIVDALTMLQYFSPTPVQKEVIPLAFAGKDLAVQSQTGSGKTAAFAIPVCELLCWEENLPQALILEPTRELAVQVGEEIFHIGRKKRIKVPVVFGGMPVDKQAVTLKQKSHIVVGTPGRVMDHVRRGNLLLSHVKYLIIDEADLMLAMGFAEEVEEIIKAVPDNRVMMLFSATLEDSIQGLIHNYMKEPVYVRLESESGTMAAICQEAYRVGKEDKYKLLLSVLEKENPADCMIFCGTREMVNVLFQKMKRDHIRCGMLHGEVEQKERLQTIQAFREGRFHILIATDVAARGVDFENITHVFHYDFPTGKETYVHRSGRTGRNGHSGKAVSFVAADEERQRKLVENYTGIQITDREVPLKEETEHTEFWKRQREEIRLKLQKGAVFQTSIACLTIAGGRKSKMRTTDIVGAICSVEGILPEDIGIIDIRDSLTYVEVLNDKGRQVLEALQKKPIKGKLRKIK